VTLAQAHLEAGRWEEARRVLQPLLEDTRAPLYAEARDLLAESYYRPALAALEAGQWEAARQGFAEVLKINPAYRDAAALEREAHLRPARAALEAGRYDEARPPTGGLAQSPQRRRRSPRPAGRKSLPPGAGRAGGGQWEAARQGFAEVLKINPAYRDAAALEREAHLRPARAALEANHYAEVRPSATWKPGSKPTKTTPRPATCWPKVTTARRWPRWRRGSGRPPAKALPKC
jgi:tetratricopeptide (TPR) repeat protein